MSRSSSYCVRSVFIFAKHSLNFDKISQRSTDFLSLSFSMSLVYWTTSSKFSTSILFFLGMVLCNVKEHAHYIDLRLPLQGLFVALPYASMNDGAKIHTAFLHFSILCFSALLFGLAMLFFTSTFCIIQFCLMVFAVRRVHHNSWASQLRYLCAIIIVRLLINMFSYRYLWRIFSDTLQQAFFISSWS